MGFFSALGRLLFASFFILSACQMFNNNGGPAAVELSSKVRHVVGLSLSLKGIGALLFVLGSRVGAYLLHIALFGALLFFIGMKGTSPKKHSKKKTQKQKAKAKAH
ncbi:uncharacterized protein LOC101212763 isoform X2 [Cucumis sativus]|uniref:uncharacterized protein LOC101212763 isoform X2 n=1 Tax=Cucumis sativus TaxID=3659 RepID=UPI0012F481BE|nr:uncharacterized protein LOC101212763 isoform X2 [Cucumis sativus]